jgi:hypothetical protein
MARPVIISLSGARMLIFRCGSQVTASRRRVNYVVTDKSTPSLVSTTSVFSDWNVTPSVSDKSFTFVPAKGVMAVTFMPLDANSTQADPNDSGAIK